MSKKSLLATQLAGALVKLDRLADATRLWKIAAMLTSDNSVQLQGKRMSLYVFRRKSSSRRPTRSAGR